MANKGILGRKLGMTQVFDDQNRMIPVTVVEAGPCRVVQLKTPERDGYAAVQLAFGDTKPTRSSKPELGHLNTAGAPAAKYLVELRVDDLSNFEVGQMIKADVFAAGERVDVTGISKGHGFSGVMKRHNFSGQGASHGNHKKHRAPGAIGACATPARVFKGVRMAGQFGSTKVTTLNLEVVEGDAERGLLLIKGSVPGANGGLVFVRNTVKAGARAHDLDHDEDGSRRDQRERGAPRRDLRDRAERRGDAPGRHRAACSEAGRHPQHQDPRRGIGWRRQAVATEGHWSRPPGFDPLAAVRGGGVAHGPKPRDYTQRTPKKMVRLALRSALSDRAAEEKVLVVDEWGITEPKTKTAKQVLADLGLRTAGERDARVLLVLFRSEPEVWKSFRNLGERVQIILPEELNAYDVLVNNWIVFSHASLDATVARLTGTETPDDE